MTATHHRPAYLPRLRLVLLVAALLVSWSTPYPAAGQTTPGRAPAALVVELKGVIGVASADFIVRSIARARAGIEGRIVGDARRLARQVHVGGNHAWLALQPTFDPGDTGCAGHAFDRQIKAVLRPAVGCLRRLQDISHVPRYKASSSRKVKVRVIHFRRAVG